MSTERQTVKEDFSMTKFLEKDMEENPEVYEAFSVDLDETDVDREDYNY